jgi:hypothetical protein
MSDKDHNQELNRNFENYSKYNFTLRAWFVLFGIGGPVTILANEHLLEVILNKHEYFYAIDYFIFGMSAQIIAAFINKICAWCNYYGRSEEGKRATLIFRRGFGNSWLFSFSSWVSRQFLIDISLDLITGFLFANGIWLIFNALVYIR